MPAMSMLLDAMRDAIIISCADGGSAIFMRAMLVTRGIMLAPPTPRHLHTGLPMRHIKWRPLHTPKRLAMPHSNRSAK